MEKIGIRNITLTRTEGPIDLCDTPEVTTTIRGANDILVKWSLTAPDTGGYDKCEFTISYKDGNSYSGRYDLKHYSLEIPDLAAHARRTAEFYAGRYCPPHMTEDQYNTFLKSIFKEDGYNKEYAEFLEKYELN